MAAENDVYRIAVRMQGEQGQDIMNVHHVQLINYVTGDDVDVADELVSELSAIYQDLEDAISDEQTGLDMSVQNVTTGAVLGSQAFNPTFQGTLTGDTMPPQTSLYTYFRTGISRRIGRKFWGIVTEAVQDAGLTFTSVSTVMVVFIAHFLGIDVGTTTGNSYVWGVYNENLAPVFVRFIEAVLQTRLKTQRRRLPGVGS